MKATIWVNIDNEEFWVNLENKSGIRGVYFSKSNNLWVAQIRRNRKVVWAKSSLDMDKVINARKETIKNYG